MTARGTTLGADNGIGVAAAMAVLEGTEFRHGPLEALFTVDEETGMTGALALQPGILRGDILLNLDSEDEGDLYIGCAGGIDTNVQFQCQQHAVETGHVAFKINLRGLQGGHSGLDIHLGRGNACLIMNGEVPTPINLPSGCVFHGRCPYAKQRCLEEIPLLTALDDGRQVACHGVEEGRL